MLPRLNKTATLYHFNTFYPLYAFCCAVCLVVWGFHAIDVNYGLSEINSDHYQEISKQSQEYPTLSETIKKVAKPDGTITWYGYSEIEDQYRILVIQKDKQFVVDTMKGK